MSKTTLQVRRLAAAEVTELAAAVIADAGPRERIAKLLAAEGIATTTFHCVKDMLEAVDEDEPSVIVLWVEDTNSSIARLIEPLGALEQTSIVVACASIERWKVHAALAAGVVGIVLADNLDEALGPCLEAARAGQVCVPRANRRQIDPPALSARERQILGLVAMGYMNSQIAQQLFLAESTVKSHLSSAFGKLGVHSRNEAVDLILDPERGFGVGILALGGEPLGSVPAMAQ